MFIDGFWLINQQNIGRLLLVLYALKFAVIVGWWQVLGTATSYVTWAVLLGRSSTSGVRNFGHAQQ
jgi:hypothetical protein